MKIAMFSCQAYEPPFFKSYLKDYPHSFQFYEAHLNLHTVNLAKEYSIVCCFVNDDLSANVLTKLAENGTQLIALRCAGFNNVDLEKAKALGLKVVNVPAYSPYAVAEHAVALIQTLNRKTHRAYNRIREGNFSLNGLLGFDLYGSTVGIIGTGLIGSRFAHIMAGFGCKLLAYDILENQECHDIGVNYVTLNELYQASDIISIHCPLTQATLHMINEQAIAQMKPGIMLINTSRGAVIDTCAVITGLKQQHIGYLGMDVYEEESNLFFEDLSDVIITDDVFARLLTFPNVLITGHQGYFTRQALDQIAITTLENITAFAEHN